MQLRLEIELITSYSLLRRGTTLCYGHIYVKSVTLALNDVDLQIS
jgi:hypothetical protein